MGNEGRAKTLSRLVSKLAVRVGADKHLRAVVSVVATVLAAFAISYFVHLNKTGADVTTGLLATLGAAGGTCSLQDMLVAVPFGLLIWFEAPPLKA